MDGFFIPVSNDKNCRIFYGRAGQIFQCNVSVMSGIDVDWRFTDGNSGGIKTTTVAVLLLGLKSNLQGKKDVEVHHRRIRDSYIRSAIVVTGMAFGVLIVMSILLCAVMPKTAVQDVVYEITSAVATVGLTRGLTPQLNAIGKWIVILTMYLGRIGPLTLGTAVTVRAQKMPSDSHLAAEDIMIG